MYICQDYECLYDIELILNHIPLNQLFYIELVHYMSVEPNKICFLDLQKFIQAPTNFIVEFGIQIFSIRWVLTHKKIPPY